MNLDQVVVIIDDFSYRSLSDDNVYYYDAGYLDTLRLYGYEPYSGDVLTIEEGNSEYLIKDSVGGYYLVNPDDFVNSNQSDYSIKAIDNGVYINNGIESYYTDFLEFNADNASDENIPLHGDWVYEAFINQLDDRTTDIILIDVDALYSDTLNNHINELFSIVENPYTQSNTTQLQLIVEDWIDNHNTDNKEYSFSVLSYSISGSTPSENLLHALDWMEEQYVMMVQAVPNNNQPGTTWASLYSNVINVGAWNVDNNNNTLFSNDQSYGLIDVFSDGYIVRPGWGVAFGTSFATPKVAAELTNEIEILISDLNSKLDSGEMTEQELIDFKPLPYSEIVTFMQNKVTDQVIVDYKNNFNYLPVNVLTDDVNTLLHPVKVSELNNGNYFYKVEDVYLITDFVIHEDDTQTRTYVDQNNIQWISEYKLSNASYNETFTNSAGEVIIKKVNWYEDGSYISSKVSTYVNNINHLAHKLWQWDSTQELETITHTNTITQQVSINQYKYDSVNNLIHSVDATSLVREGVIFNYDTSLRLADDNLIGPLTYNSTTAQFNGLPGWLAIDTSTGILSGTPQADDLGDYEILISVIDNSGLQVSDIFTLMVVDSTTQIDLTNNIPVVVNDTATTDEDVSVDINVLSNDIDIDGDTLSIIFAAADNGIVTINDNSILTYISSQNFNGTDTITYTVSDAKGGTGTGTVTIDVVAVNDAPIISTSIVNSTVLVNELHTFDVSANFSDVDSVLIYSVLMTDGSALPSWISIDAVTGILNGTPLDTDVGTINVVVTATDNAGASVSDSYILTVNNASINNTFQINNTQVFLNGYNPDANNGAGQDTQTQITFSSTGSSLTIDTGVNSFNLQNLINAANNTGNFKYPVLSMDLLGVPDDASGTGIVVINLIDNEDNNSTFNQGAWSMDGSLDGDRKLSIELAVNWSSDAGGAQISLPDQAVTIEGWFRDGEKITKSINLINSDVISVTNADAINPATLNFNFASLITQLENVAPMSVLQEGNFYLTVDMAGLPLSDSAGNAITGINSELSVVDSEFIIDADIIEVRNAETVTKMQASIDEYGADYTAGDTSKVMKFEMWVNAAELDAFGIGATEIRGYQFDMDWTATEVQPLSWSITTGEYIGTANTEITFNSTTGAIAVANSGAIVDTITTNDGSLTFTGSESLIATFYINPVEGLEFVNLSVKDILVVTELGNIEPRDFTSAMELSSVNATVQTDALNYLDGISLNYFKDGVDTGVSTLVENGNISFDQALDFDSVKLSDPAAYNSGVQADDAVAVLRHIVELDSLDGNATSWNAADVNNNGVIQADDAVSILRDIVELDDIDHFDLVDNVTGNLVNSLDLVAKGNWTIVANGDVNGSGTYNDEYTVVVDIV